MKIMSRHATFIFLFFTVTLVVSAQDTLYFDAGKKRVASMDSAVSYRICIPDKIRNGNMIENNYSKSGKLKSSCSFILQFKKNANKAIVESYIAGKLRWNDPEIEKVVQKSKDGTYKEWYDNGQLRKEIEYKEGKMNGHYISFWENGQIKREEFPGSDKPVEGKCFDRSGTEIKHTPIEQMPEFPGGIEGLRNFLTQNVKYPLTMAEEKVEGKVVAQFVVRKDGSLSDIKIVRSIHPDGDKEAMRVISLMPKWKPGIQEDEPVLVKFTLPITFKLTESYNNDPFIKRNGNRTL